MKAAGLKPIATVIQTQAVLIRSRGESRSPALSESNGGLQSLIRNRIRGIIAAKKYILLNYNVPRSLLPEAKKITPGKRAPTVSHLESEGEEWVAVSVMVERTKAAEIMDDLEDIGASDILVFNITNSRYNPIDVRGLMSQSLSTTEVLILRVRNREFVGECQPFIDSLCRHGYSIENMKSSVNSCSETCILDCPAMSLLLIGRLINGLISTIGYRLSD